MSGTPFIPISLDTQALDAALTRIADATGDLTPLMASMRQELLAQTEANFASQGRPSWPGLADATKEQREARRKWPGQILQVSGTLARAITGKSDSTSAMIGVGAEVPYAAIHQFGGQAGRNRKVTVVARPYLPMIGNTLQPQAETALLELAHDYLLRAAEGESKRQP